MRSFRLFLVISGNILYHFDRALFNLLIPFLAPLFFPKLDPIYAIMCMYIIAPLSLLAKPLGALVFGSLGDRLGRRKILSITLIGMSIKTGLMGFLPTYDQIGVFAPLLLGFTRLAISFFSAGETTGGAIFLLEQSKQENRNFVSSLFDASGILGVLIASCSIWLMSSYEGFWRILFWIGGITGVVGWIFRKLGDDEEIPFKEAHSSFRILWEHRSALFAVAAVAGFSYANYYLITSFMNGFLPLISSITKTEAIALNNLLLIVDFLLLPLFGFISLKIRKETLILIAILGIMSSAIPLFLLLNEVTLFKAGCLRIILTLFGVCLAAPYHAWVFERTPSSHRYLIGAFGTALGGKILGSPIPAIGFWIYHQTGLVIAPALPIILVGIFPLICILKEKPLPKPLLKL